MIFQVGEIYEVYRVDVPYNGPIPIAYMEYLIDGKYPIGTLFRCYTTTTSFNGDIGFRLLIDGEEVRQSGRVDGLTVTVPHSIFRPYKQIPELLAMEKLKPWRY
jgi:hypothetical protein